MLKHGACVHAGVEFPVLATRIDLRRELGNREWASYHDLYSTENPDADPLELTDHLTGGGWLEGLETLLLPWRLTKKRLHMIQCVRGCNRARTV